MYDGDDVAVIAVEFALLMIGEYLQLSLIFCLIPRPRRSHFSLCGLGHDACSLGIANLQS